MRIKEHDGLRLSDDIRAADYHCFKPFGINAGGFNKLHYAGRRAGTIAAVAAARKQGTG